MNIGSDLPEGAMFNAGVRVVQYLDADGEMKTLFGHEGDVPLSTFLGLLEIGKQMLHNAAAEW